MPDVKVLRRTLRTTSVNELGEELGEKSYSWVEDSTIYSAVAAPANTTEDFSVIDDVTVETLTLHFRNIDLDINAKDEVLFDSERWQVQGARAFYENPFSRSINTSINVTRAER